jgi:hypothetical protein
METLVMQIGSEFEGWRRAARATVCVLAAWLVSCGGGTSQIEPFAPRQIILLGDETVLLAADGKRFGINGLDTNSAIDCTLDPVWGQTLVANFGLVLDRCNPSAATDVRGVTRGAPGAKAADLNAQITAQFAASPPTSKDLFVVMVGLNDVIECYEVAASCSDGLANRGLFVAQQVNRIIAAGGRVIVSTVHDLGLTPYARAKDAVSPGQGALLTQMTATFNARVRVEIVQDGRYVGLVLADDLTQLMARAPGNYSLTNVTDAACNVALPDCTTATLVSGATATSHLWADDRHFGPAVQFGLATLAETRARNNPF